MRSLISSVGSIEPDGIQKTCRKKARMMRARIRATTIVSPQSKIQLLSRRRGTFGCPFGHGHLFDLGGPAAYPLSQVIEFRAADFAGAQELDALDLGRVNGEGPLDADPLDQLADGEILAVAAAGPFDDDAFKALHPLLAALDDLGIDLDRVTDLERRDVLFLLACFDLTDNAHSSSLLLPNNLSNIIAVAERTDKWL